MSGWRDCDNPSIILAGKQSPAVERSVRAARRKRQLIFYGLLARMEREAPGRESSTASARNEPVSLRAGCAGPLARRHEHRERCIRFLATRLLHEPLAPNRPNRSRSIPQVDHNAHSPGACRAGTKWQDRSLDSSAVQCFSKGALTRRCTGQALTVVDVSAWRDPFRTSIFSPVEPALAGELGVSTTRKPNRWEFDWVHREDQAPCAGPQEQLASILYEPIAPRAGCAGPLAGWHEHLESASGFAQRACATSPSRECWPRRSRLIHQVVRHAPARGPVA